MWRMNSLVTVGLVWAFVAKFLDAKLNKLALLTFMPFDKGQMTFPGCNAAVQVAIENVNNRNDILAEYEIIQDIQSEGYNAFSGNEAIVTFWRKYTSGNINNISMAPVVVGPTTSCQTNALSIRQLGFTIFSEQCTGPAISRRRNLFSNTYSIQMPTENSVAAGVAMITKIGKWKQIAILAYALNANEYLNAGSLNTVVSSLGVNVLYYASIPEVTPEAIVAVKDSGARIIALVMSQQVMCIQYFCLTYSLGMRAPQYVFIDLYSCILVPPDSPSVVLPKGCTVSMVSEQLKITFFTTISKQAMNNYGKSSFGYDLKEFEARYNQLTGNAKMPDADFRHLCHDAAMAALITLNRSEAVLQSRYNSSLKDFQTNQKFVSEIVNATATTIDFVGLRIGRISYSKRLELTEDLWIAQMTGGVPRNTYRIVLNSSLPPLDPGGIILTKFANIDWFTRSGNPPKDLSDITHRIASCGLSLVYSLDTIATVLSGIQLAMSFYAFRKRACPTMTDRILLSFDIAVPTLACFSLNAASSVVVSGIEFFQKSQCTVMTILMTVGLSFLNAHLLSAVINFANLKHFGRKTVLGSRSTLQPDHRSVQPTTRSHQLTSKMSTTGSLQSGLFSQKVSSGTAAIIICLCTTIYIVPTLVTWNAVDPYHVERFISEISLDEEIDSYYDIAIDFCKSNYFPYWVAILTALQAFLLMATGFLAYTMSKLNIPEKHKRSCKLLQAAAANSCGLFFCFILALLVVSSTKCLALVILAVGLLLYSGTTGCMALIAKFPDKSAISCKAMSTGTLAKAASTNRFSSINLPDETY